MSFRHVTAPVKGSSSNAGRAVRVLIEVNRQIQKNARDAAGV
jgi:hypothetical protein